MNDLFGVDTTDGDKLVYVNDVIKGKLMESTSVRVLETIVAAVPVRLMKRDLLFVAELMLPCWTTNASSSSPAATGSLFRQRAQLQKDVSTLTQEVAANSALFQESSNLLKSAHKVNFMATKHLHETSPCAARVLSYILEAQQDNVKWRANGSSPKEGFDSPRFAAYMLEYAQVLSASQYDGLTSQSISGAQQRLITAFHANGANPSDGDLVFYKSGYICFYFRDSALMRRV